MQLFNSDCREILKKLDLQKAIIVSDLPFNIGYHYGTYKDNLNEDEYIAMLKEVFEGKKKRCYSLSRIALQNGCCYE